jgi:hypothetical protein
MTNTRKSLLISGLLLPIVAGVLVELFTSISVLAFVQRLLTSIAGFFAVSFGTPLWALILVFLAGFVVRSWIAKTSKTSIPETIYKRDHILGIDWQWGYSSGEVVDLVPICPQCKYQPPVHRFHIGDYAAAGEGCLIQCDHCGFKKEFDFLTEVLQDRITREIHRKIRTGEFAQRAVHGGSA